MSGDYERRVKLEGVLERTSSTIEICKDGSIKVEFYDFSDDAERMMGGDVCLCILVAPLEKSRLLELLASEAKRDVDVDGLLLSGMKARFHSYFDVKQWFDDQSIPYTRHSEPFP